jgi:hypothetical protein
MSEITPRKKPSDALPKESGTEPVKAAPKKRVLTMATAVWRAERIAKKPHHYKPGSKRTLVSKLQNRGQC